MSKPNLFGKRAVVPLLLAVTLLCACIGRKTLFHTYQSLPSAGWLRGDTLSFDIDVSDSLTFYHLSVGIRHQENYPYQNFPLSVSWVAPDNTLLSSKTLLITLSDSLGNWVGKGLGNLYQTSISAGELPVHAPGRYQVRISSHLPDNLLPGISDIGIQIER